MQLDSLKNLLLSIGFTEDRAKQQLALLGILTQKKISTTKTISSLLIEEATIRDYFDNVTSELSFSKRELVKRKLDDLLT